jgi:neutral amino acid transport system substrate-binding protein
MTGIWIWVGMANDSQRRSFLKGIAGAGTVAIAGCTGSDGLGDGSGDGSDNEETETSSDLSGDALNIGVLFPYTGEYDWVGSDIFPVVEMIAAEINDAGGINGKEINLVKGDTEATVDAAVTATKKLINVDNVQAFIGPTSLTYTGTIDLFQENGVVTVSPTGSTTELDDIGGKYQFRTVPSDNLGGRAIAKAARSQDYNTVKAYERMAVMSGKAPALQAFKRPVTRSFEKFGGTIVENMDFSVGQSSYNAEISQVLESDPEIITLVGTPEDSEKILRAAFQAGYEGNWFFTQDQTNDDFVSSVDKQLTEGAFGLKDAVSPDAVEADRIEQFKQDVKDFTGSEPGFFAENSYDAMNIIGLAMKRAAVENGEVTRQGIADNIRPVAKPSGETVRNYTDGANLLEDGTDINYEGLVGPLDFDDNGNVLASFAILQATEGAWNRVATVPPEELE